MNPKDIHPELRLTGRILMRMPDRWDLAKMGTASEKVLKGKWFSPVSHMHEEYISRDDGTQLRLCIAAKKNGKTDDLTGILWIHGGGFAVGMPEQDASFADVFLSTDQALVIMPQYRKSYEAPYPAALTDCYLALLWMAANAEKLGIRQDQIFVGGNSAGGNLAAALCLLARDRKEVNVAFQMPLYPMLDDRDTETSADNDAPVWNTEKNHAAWAMYKGDRTDVPAYCAPARAADLSGLPPAFTYVGDIEPFYAETLAYCRKLYEADVPVMYRVFPGCFHGFDITVPYASCAKKARKLLKEAFLYARQNYRAAQEPGKPDGMALLKSLIDASVRDELAALDHLLEHLDR